jgi:hypothetical protein
MKSVLESLKGKRVKKDGKRGKIEKVYAERGQARVRWNAPGYTIAITSIENLANLEGVK